VEFQVGEKVIYPNHGVGVVEKIQDDGVPGGVYVLRLLGNESRVWVPRRNADGVGLRPVISARDARKLLGLLGDGCIDQHANWKGRFKENSDKMRTGSVFEVAMVLKGLTALSRKKSLSFREKRMLDRAKFLIVSEVAEAEGKPQSSIETLVDQALSQTLSQARPAAASPKAAQKPLAKPVARRPTAEA